MGSSSENRLIWLTVLAGFGIFTVLFCLGFWQTEGVFVYPLDDPYIHLSMAEQIAVGEYGINRGEYASADSSLLFPLLLLPFAGTALHVFMPLLVNALSLVAALYLLAKIALESGLITKSSNTSLVVISAVLAPVALNFQGLALIGMEHMLHVCLVLLALLGLLRWLSSGVLNGLLVAAILLGPLVRYESLGLSIILSGVLFFGGRRKAGLALAVAAVAPLVLFGLWLTTLGLSFVPNSVMAKAAIVDVESSTFMGLLTHNFDKFGHPVFASLFLIVSSALLAYAFWPRTEAKDQPGRTLALVAAGIGFGHAIFGRFGWADRYEIYALAYLALTSAILLRRSMPKNGSAAAIAVLALLVALGAGVYHYLGTATARSLYAPVNIYSQHMQMARLARRYTHVPMLMNDIGLPSFQNEVKIVDLYGLASKEALDARREQAERGWPNRIAEREAAGMAMVYTEWLTPNLAPGWQPVAHLDLIVPYKFVLDRVTIFATRPDMVAPIKTLLTEFEPTLPRYATLEFVDAQPEPPQEEGQ